MWDIKGEGPPEGNRAATPGTRYTDTRATDGAVLWVKESGSGATGWRAELTARDSAVLQSQPFEGLAGGTLDADDRLTWLTADLSGGPTEYALSRLRTALAPALPTQDWAHWGDSLTDERVTGAQGWVTKLAALTGRNHFNGGWYSQLAGQIAARQGGLPALVTVTANTIPASGSVTVTTIRNSPVNQHATLGVTGTLAGIPGTMREVMAGAVTFARTTPGDAVSCPPGTRFIPDVGVANRDRQVTIWVGRNDVYVTDPQLVVAAVKAQIDHLSPSVKRALVLEVPPSETSPATHAQLAAINAALKAAFPAEWVPVSSFLRTAEAATAAGVEFTADDDADIAAGITPRVFRSDAVHLNGTGCTAVAYYIHKEAQRRGWIA